MGFSDDVRMKVKNILENNYSEDINWLNEMSSKGLDNKEHTKTTEDLQI